LIINFVDVPIREAADLRKVVASAPIATKLELAILRDGKRLAIQVELGARSNTSVHDKHWIETYVLAHGGCGFLDHQLRVSPLHTDVVLRARRGERIDQIELFGKAIGAWSDEDLDAATMLFRTCVERQAAAAAGSWKRSPVDDMIITEGDRNLHATIITAQKQLAGRKTREEARVVAEQSEAQRKREQAAEEARTRQEQLREQARRDKEAAEEARQFAEAEAPKIAEATKEAEEARRAREAAEQKLAEIRSRIGAEERARRDALAHAQAAEAARQNELQREADREEDARLTRKCKVNQDQFKQVQPGMSLREVERIFGCKGTEVSSTRISGIGLMTTYSWEGKESPSAATATFRNSRLESKAQLGLE
jgi:chemotaxis protein histidine kinase CheA